MAAGAGQAGEGESAKSKQAIVRFREGGGNLDAWQSQRRCPACGSGDMRLSACCYVCPARTIRTGARNKSWDATVLSGGVP